MRIGLLGFPMTGKTTLFQLLTGVEVQDHGSKREHVGMTKVPEPRLDRLAEMYTPKKFTPATIEYLDLAGMAKGEATKVLPLDQLRTVDCLAHVVRNFNDEAIPHSETTIDAARDAATMETELIMADHSIAERRVEKLDTLVMKTNRDEEKKELALMRRVVAHLETEMPLRTLTLDEYERATLKGYTFLSLKPLLIIVNADEDDAAKLDEGPAAFGLEAMHANEFTEVVALSAKIEAEIAQLDAEDAEAFRSELGIKEPALERMIKASYRLLGQISFFTVGEDECRAWTIGGNTTARKAAGVIHSDIEKGFIRAEVLPYDDLMAVGSWNAAKEKGTLRIEGKEYIIKDGDIAHFRFNV